MPLTRVQATPNTIATNVRTATVTFPAAPTIGNGIVLAMAYWLNQTVSFADNRGHVYTLAVDRVVPALSSTRVNLYYLPRITATGSPFTITVTASPANIDTWIYVAIEVGGLGGGALAVDQVITNVGNSLTPGTGLTPPLTANEVFILAIEAIQQWPPTITVETVSPPWIQEAERAVIGSSGEADSRIRTGVLGTQQQCNWTHGNADSWVAALAAFRVASPPAVERSTFFQIGPV